MEKLSYIVIKLYKGMLKRNHKGNIHILTVTNNYENKIKHFAYLGNLKNKKDIKVFSLLSQTDINYQNMLMDELYKKFKKKNVIILEELDCKTIPDNNDLIIDIQEKGKYIKSDIKFKFLDEHSNGRQMLYFVYGNIDIKGAELNLMQSKMVSKKLSSLAGNKI